MKTKSAISRTYSETVGLRIGMVEVARIVVLVVDDDPVICNLMALSLEQEGFRVLTAPSGWEALTRWQSHWRQIDLLITDRQPDQDMMDILSEHNVELLIASEEDR